MVLTILLGKFSAIELRSCKLFKDRRGDSASQEMIFSLNEGVNTLHITWCQCFLLIRSTQRDTVHDYLKRFFEVDKIEDHNPNIL